MAKSKHAAMKKLAEQILNDDTWIDLEVSLNDETRKEAYDKIHHLSGQASRLAHLVLEAHQPSKAAFAGRHKTPKARRSR